MEETLVPQEPAASETQPSQENETPSENNSTEAVAKPQQKNSVPYHERWNQQRTKLETEWKQKLDQMNQTWEQKLQQVQQQLPKQPGFKEKWQKFAGEIPGADEIGEYLSRVESQQSFDKNALFKEFQEMQQKAEQERQQQSEAQKAAIEEALDELGAGDPTFDRNSFAKWATETKFTKDDGSWDFKSLHDLYKKVNPPKDPAAQAKAAAEKIAPTQKSGTRKFNLAQPGSWSI